MNKRKPTVTLGHRLQIHERRTDDPKRKLHVKTPDALCWDRSLLSLTISSQTPPDSSKIRGRDIPSRLEQKRQRLSVYPAHLALNCRTYKYYHPRTNLNLAAGEGGGARKEKMVLTVTLDPLLCIFSPSQRDCLFYQVFLQKKDKIQNRTIIVPCHTSDECFLFSAHPINEPTSH